MDTSRLKLSVVSASSLSPTWLRITGRDRWLPVTATVFTCEWTQKPGTGDGSIGHHRVVYSYSVDGNRYSGQFSDLGLEFEDYLKPGDAFTVRYDPDNRSRSYYPDLRTRRNFNLICCGIGLSLAVLVLAIRALMHGGS